MKTLKTITIQLPITLLLLVVAFNVPARWLSLNHWFGEQKLGTVSLTTLNSSDNISDFPTTYNANNSVLNNQKVDIASSTWAQLTTATGLITTGVLGGASGSSTYQGNAVTGRYGGTSSTTLSVNQVLLGNGTDGIKVVNNWGTSGQFLTSGGEGAVPTWTTAAFDTAGNYTLTGFWTFQGNSTYFQSGTTTTTGKLHVGTTTPISLVLHTTGFTVSTSTYFGKAVGIGIATTSSGSDLQVAGSAIFNNASTTGLSISGSCLGCPMSYTGSSTDVADLGATFTYTGAIPANANTGVGNYTVSAGPSSDDRGTFVVTRSGLTSSTFGYNATGTPRVWTAQWSGTDLIMTESNNSMLTFTIYWYK